jgi:hypothetical protein
MDDKIELLMTHVERLLLHVRHSVPPEVVVVDDVEKLIGEIREERKERRVRRRRVGDSKQQRR